MTASHSFHGAPFLLLQSDTSPPQSNQASEEAKAKENDLASAVLSSVEKKVFPPCAGKIMAAEAITVNKVDTTNSAYSYWTWPCLGCKEYDCRVSCFMLYYCAIYEICLIFFQCLLYFDFIIADARLNGPGAPLCDSHLTD